MPGIDAIGVTLHSGVENCNFLEPPPLLRFNIGVVANPPGIGLFNGSNSMVSAPPAVVLIAMLSMIACAIFQICLFFCFCFFAMHFWQNN